jgi:hypothetical protein
MPHFVSIGNAAGFWGDDLDAPATLVRQAPQLQYLTLDYLAEVSMSILAKQMQRDGTAGYARDFLDVLTSLFPVFKSGRKIRIVTNAGGLNPRGCALVCAKILRDAGCSALRIGIVDGDNVMPHMRESIAAGDDRAFRHLETGESILTIGDRLCTANAYFGAAPLAEALSRGADIVITGRVADPSLTVAPAIAEFGWKLDDYQKIAGATVAGHLIECGAQATGGISTDWMTVPDPTHIGFPIAEVFQDGSCVITKPPNTSGRVNRDTIREQLVYEIGDPANYLSPDATVSFLSLSVQEEAPDRVRVNGAIGGPPPADYKVSATYHAGYRATGLLTIFGRDAREKAIRCGKMVLDRLTEAGAAPRQSRVECLGTGEAAGGAVDRGAGQPLEVVLRISVADPKREVVERFSRMIAPLITAGPQGITGYADIPRPAVREIFGYWPTLIPRQRVVPRVEILEV